MKKESPPKNEATLQADFSKFHSDLCESSVIDTPASLSEPMPRKEDKNETRTSVDERYSMYLKTIGQKIDEQVSRIRNKIPLKGIAAEPIFISLSDLEVSDKVKGLLNGEKGVTRCRYTDQDGEKKAGYFKKNSVLNTVLQYISDRIQAHLFYRNPMLGPLFFKAVNSKLLLDENGKITGMIMSDIREER